MAQFIKFTKYFSGKEIFINADNISYVEDEMICTKQGEKINVRENISQIKSCIEVIEPNQDNIFSQFVKLFT